jgi:tRNA(Ser,Leu) C12 N-acetylase TAN1
MPSTNRVKKWREKKAKEGGRSLSVWLKPETAQMMDELKKELKAENASVIAQAIKTLYEVTCNKEPPQAQAEKKEEPASLLDLITKVDQGTPMAELKDDVAKLLKQYEAQGDSDREVAKYFNSMNLPTVSGEKKWKVKEIRTLKALKK